MLGPRFSPRRRLITAKSSPCAPDDRINSRRIGSAARYGRHRAGFPRRPLGGASSGGAMRISRDRLSIEVITDCWSQEIDPRTSRGASGFLGSGLVAWSIENRWSTHTFSSLEEYV